eukprot:TRINITY_DN7940_c0_g1_i1.p1 TRINITY_DN7940_c0_g1~~TRINITY_DN7940_c0_g1_i1.p1  ORF type:complete len:311 (+),score=68.49 TRINITY_DN7940_c0_g1_i1:49-981(+)
MEGSGEVGASGGLLRFGVFCDFSDLSLTVLEVAFHLAEHNKRKQNKHHRVHVSVCTFVEIPSDAIYLPDEMEEKINEQKTLANERLHRFTKNHLKEDLETEVRTGNPRDWLKGYVEEKQLDFLFLGSRGLSSLMGFLMGSTSQYALHNCPCPTVFIKNTSPTHPNHFGIFYDFSPSSEFALECVINLFPTHPKAKLFICVCVERPQTDSPWGKFTSEADAIEKENIQNTRKKLETVYQLLKEEDIHHVTDVKAGDPRSWVDVFVQNHKIDILFLGSRGHSTELSGFLMGSTSQHALHSCSCTVVVTHKNK